MRSWINTAATLKLSPKTAERYRQLIEQIVPHLGALPLQKLKRVHVANWHATLLKAGSRAKVMHFRHAQSATRIGFCIKRSPTRRGMNC